MRKLLFVIVPMAILLVGCSSSTETSTTSTPEPGKTAETPKTDAPTPGPTTQTASMVTCDECKKEVDAKDIVPHGGAKICKACESHHNH